MAAAGAALVVIGCARPQPVPAPLADEVRGLLEVGYEAYDFRSCAPSDAPARRVRPDSGVSLATSQNGGKGAFNSQVYYVRVRGALDSVGPLDPGGGPRALHVHAVLEIRPPRRGECGWVPGRGLAG
jgi:hypothetical protein